MAVSRKKTPARKSGAKSKTKAPAGKKTPAKKKPAAKKKVAASKAKPASTKGRATPKKKASAKAKTKAVKPNAKSRASSSAKKGTSAPTATKQKRGTAASEKKDTAKKLETTSKPKATRKPPEKLSTPAPEKPKGPAVKALDDYMNDAHLEEFRQQLLGWKQQLMEEVDRTVTHMKDVATNDPDPADRATQEEEFTLELKTRDRERRLIKKIDSTLEAIEIGDYGFCESCGIEIGVERLRARPTATQCIDCKTLAEIREKQTLG